MTGGTGLAVVVGSGTDTEIGAIQALMVHTEHPKTPIQQQLDQLGNRLVMLSSGICAGVFAIGLLRGHGLLQMFKSSISLAIAAVSEGLPTVASTSLARGLRLMREKQMLIRRLQAGRRSHELMDGRLRLDEQSAQDGDQFALSQLLRMCVLCQQLTSNRPSGRGILCAPAFSPGVSTGVRFR